MPQLQHSALCVHIQSRQRGEYEGQVKNRNSSSIFFFALHDNIIMTNAIELWASPRSPLSDIFRNFGALSDEL
jgi:hypothetical protein